MRKKAKRNSKILLSIVSFLFLLGHPNLIAQAYENAVGVKAGYSSGVVFKHFTDRDFALEGQALYNPLGFQVTVLYEYQFTPHPKERLHYYFGGGIHSGNWENEFALGVAALAGSEYVFRKAPLVLGLEWKPMFNIYKVSDFAIPDIALTVKVTLN